MGAVEVMDSAYRDAALKILIVVATGFIGYITTATSDPRIDTITLVWLALLAVCFAALIAISHASEKRRHRFVTQEQHAEVIARLDKQRSMMELMLEAQQQTMRSGLIRDAERYMERGWITAEEHRAYSEAFAAYEHLGLNGYIRTYLEKVDELPLKSL